MITPSPAPVLAASPAAPGKVPVLLPVLTTTALVPSVVWPTGWNALAMFSRPWPNVVSGPAAPRSSALLNSKAMICCPVRLGNACAISATAPEMIGAEKLVPV